MSEAVIDPDLPILDAHHHLWLDGGHTGAPYTLDDLHADTGTGHNVVGTVFVECHAEYLRDGPDHLRPVGEVAFVADAAEASASRAGAAEILAIVGRADLALGDAVEEVLLAEQEAGRGRFRGIRFTTAFDPSPMNNAAPRAGMLGEAAVRDGARVLARLGLSFDVFCFHPQLPEVVDLARAVPDVQIVLNHLGVPIAGGPYRGRAAEVRSFWQTQMQAVAECENVVLKLGGLNRPLSGDRWDKDPTPPSSELIVAAWGEEMRFAIETFGPSRCLFESNFPVDKRTMGYVELWNAAKKIAAPYTDAERRDLFHDTAARAYRLPTLATRTDS